jgi:hypothetical protein
VKVLLIPFFGTFLCCCGVAAAQQPRNAAEAPGIDELPPSPPEWTALGYPRSSFIPGMELDMSTRRREAPGSDIWPITWADDGHQYAAFGDGGGFGGTNQLGRASMGVARIEGDYDDYRGVNVWGGKDAASPAEVIGKGTGIICVDGVLYMWVGRPQIVAPTTLAFSRDHGRTWQFVDWDWRLQDGVSTGVFVNSGRDHADAPDRYVYACFTRTNFIPEKPRNWLYERPGRIDLARVARDSLANKTAWEWFAGADENGAPRWTTDIKHRQPAFEDPNGIKVVSVCYQPALGRYLITYTPRDTGGNFALFEAPRPWGPWNEVVYWKAEPLFQPPMPNGRVSIYHFAPKWWSADGREFTLVYNTGDDAWNTVRGRLNVRTVVERR